jgi:hypothetical protein
MYIFSSFIFRSFPLLKHYDAIALWPFVLFKHDKSNVQIHTIRHEKIHIVQQVETGIIFFYAIYFSNYLINLIIYKNHWKAYKNICFEREAYANETNRHYFKFRKIWNFINYI